MRKRRNVFRVIRLAFEDDKGCNLSADEVRRLLSRLAEELYSQEVWEKINYIQKREKGET